MMTDQVCKMQVNPEPSPMVSITAKRSPDGVQRNPGNITQQKNDGCESAPERITLFMHNTKKEQ